MEKEPKIKKSKSEQIEENIDKVSKLNRDFINEVLLSIQEHIKKEKDNPKWPKLEKEFLQERELIDEISGIGRESGVLIDPQYWTIKMGLSRRLGVERLQAIKELATHFIPFKKIKGHLKEINVQHDEAYLSLGCQGLFHDGVAEIPNYVTFNNENPENFYATFVHEAIGHPVGVVIENIDDDDKTRKLFMKNHQKIARQKAFFKGAFGRVYSKREMADFGQFIAEFTKQYCLEGDDLRLHIESLPDEQRKAYQNFYEFFKTSVYDGREFNKQDLKSLNAIARSIREEAEAPKS